MSNLSKLRAKPNHVVTSGSAQALLAWIGVPKSKVFAAENSAHKGRVKSIHRMRSKSHKSKTFYFWYRSQWELADLLNEARRIYKKRIKEIHPDKPGGSNSQTVALNLAMRRIEHLFKRKGITTSQ